MFVFVPWVNSSCIRIDQQNQAKVTIIFIETDTGYSRNYMYFYSQLILLGSCHTGRFSSLFTHTNFDFQGISLRRPKNGGCVFQNLALFEFSYSLHWNRGLSKKFVKACREWPDPRKFYYFQTRIYGLNLDIYYKYQIIIYMNMHFLTF